MKTVKGMDRLLTYEQAAEMIGRSRTRIDQLLHKGELTREKFGQHRRIRESVVRAYLARRAVPEALPLDSNELVAA